MDTPRLRGDVSPPELVADSVVEIHVDGQFSGSGFFVLPDGILVTCAHVLNSDHSTEDTHLGGGKIHVVHRGRRYEAEVLEALSDAQADIAVLRAKTDTVCPFSPLDPTLEPFDQFFGFGFQRYESGYRGYPVKGTISGRTQQRTEGDGAPQTLIVLECPNMEAGQSGSPILDLRTGGVVGIAKRNLASPSGAVLIGGYAVPVDALFRCYKQLRARNREAQEEHHTPLKRVGLFKYLVAQGMIATTERYNMRCIYPMTDQFYTNISFREGMLTRRKRALRIVARAVARQLPIEPVYIADPVLFGYSSMDERRLVQGICMETGLAMREMDYGAQKAAVVATLTPTRVRSLATYVDYLTTILLLFGPPEPEIHRAFGRSSHKVVALLSTDLISELTEAQRWTMING